MRALLCVGSLLLLLWAVLAGHAPDQLMYYGIFLVVNLVHLIVVLFYEKTIELNPHLERLWNTVFSERGYNLEMIDFYNLCQEKSFLTSYKPGDSYIKEGSRPGKLSILLTGKMLIYKNDSYQRKQVYMTHHSTASEREVANKRSGGDAFCGTVYPLEFIDSYEWLMGQGEYVNANFGAPEEQYSQVEIKVDPGCKECLVLEWSKDHLEAVFKEHPRLRVCIHALVGKDIAEKMLRIAGHSVTKVNPVSNMVRAAHSHFMTTYKADVLPFGKKRTELDWNSKYDMSEVASNVFDESVPQNNCDSGRYTWYPGEIVTAISAQEAQAINPGFEADGNAPVDLGEPDRACCHVKWAPMSNGKWGIHGRVELNVPLETLRKVNPDFSNFDDNGVPTTLKAVGADPERPLSSEEKEQLRVQMENNEGFCHERLTGLAKPGIFGPSYPPLNNLMVTTPVVGEQVSRIVVEVPNLTKMQLKVKSKLGAGPWCELDDEVLQQAPWTCVVDFDEGKREPVTDIPSKGQQNYDTTQLAMHSLKCARLRVTNARLLGVAPTALESLQPSSDAAEQDKLHRGELHRFFTENCPGLEPRNLHEILKWGKWRSFYRPCTTIVRQGEEAGEIGIVLQGRLSMYTEDEFSRYKKHFTNIDKFDLFGSEDFSSKYRTARRTIMMPPFTYNGLEDDGVNYEDAENEHQPLHVLPKHPVSGIPTHPNFPHGKETSEQGVWEYVPWSGSYGAGMYEMMLTERPGDVAPSDVSGTSDRRTIEEYMGLKIGDKAQLASGNHQIEWQQGSSSARSALSLADQEYLKERYWDAKKSKQEDICVSTIPTVLFMWDIKDLKRLMLADPKVEHALSKLLGADIGAKLNTADTSAMGTRTCGIAGTARGDEDVTMAGRAGCGPSTEDTLLF